MKKIFSFFLFLFCVLQSSKIKAQSFLYKHHLNTKIKSTHKYPFSLYHQKTEIKTNLSCNDVRSTASFYIFRLRLDNMMCLVPKNDCEQIPLFISPEKSIQIPNVTDTKKGVD